MRQFIFPQGKVWVLDDGEELGVAALDQGGVALLVFTDDDLATTYAAANGLTGKKAKAVQGGSALADFLEAVRRLGATRVAIDHAAGQTAHAVAIDKAIEHARQQAG